MPLDFPSNPVNGQVYDNFYYDSTMGTWRSLTVATVPQIPAGVISQYAGSNAPGGYLLCTGQSLLVSDYPDLFSAIGYTYGGSGSSFLIPNLQNRIPVGRGTDVEFDTLGEMGGVKSTSLTSNHIPEHNHSINHDHASVTTSTDGNHSHSPAGGSTDGFVAHLTALDGTQQAGIPTTINGYIVATRNTNTAGAHSHTVDLPLFTGTSGNYGTASGSITPVSALQPYIVLNYIIKT